MRQARAGTDNSLETLRMPSHNGTRNGDGRKDHMPTLFRLLMTIALFAALIYGAMFALANFVEPKKGEISVRVPLENIGKP